MVDIQFIRDNIEAVKQAAQNKNVSVDIDKLLELDHKRRELLQQVEKLRKARNENASQMQNGQPSPELVAEGKRIKESLGELETQLEPTESEYASILKSVPNIPLDFVPIGSTEDDNVVQKTVGDVPKFTFKPKSDAELGQINDSFDKERAAKVSGARFVYIKGDLVQMQFAIIQFVLQTLSDQSIIQKIIDDQGLKLSAKAFTPVLPPAMVKTEPYEASGRLDAEEMTYKLSQDELWMNASAEHSMCTMYMNETLDEDQLPIRYVAYSTSFRREAGSYGKDAEGIFRMHQFDKIEMEVFSTAETGLEEHKLLVAIQEYLVQKLGLPYQLIQKCTADIGKPNAQGVDINTWMPAQGEYRETHTADYMTDFQARSLKTKVKRTSGTLEFVHTNDATAFALGRILKAIMENYQQEDGSIVVPEVLRPFMGGKEKI